MKNNSIGFNTGKSVEAGTKKDYGKYGIYRKQEDGTWKRLKKGYPAFRKTLNYQLMKSFLVERGECEKFLDRSGIKTLRSMIKSKGIEKEYDEWLGENNGEKI